MKQKRFTLILGRTLFGLAVLVVVLSVIAALGMANGLHGLTPVIYGLGGPELGNLITGLVQPFLSAFSMLIGIGGVILAVIIFALGQILLHFRTLSLRIEALEKSAGFQE